MRILALLTCLSASLLPAQPVFEPPEERGRAVLEAVLKAAGGREKLAAVQDMTSELQSKVVTPQGVLEMESRQRFVLPDTVRQDITLPAGQISIGFDRWSGWRQGPQGRQPIPPDELRRTQAHLARVNLLFRPPSDPKAVRWAGTEAVDGRPCDLLEIANVGGVTLRLHVDRETRDILKRSYRGEAPDGKTAEVQEFLSDYRPTAGLRLNFKVRELRDGKFARESLTRSIQLNQGLKVEDLMGPLR